MSGFSGLYPTQPNCKANNADNPGVDGEKENQSRTRDCANNGNDKGVTFVFMRKFEGCNVRNEKEMSITNVLTATRKDPPEGSPLSLKPRYPDGVVVC